MTGDLVPFPPRPLAREDARAAVDRALTVPIPERTEKARELYLDDPEFLLCLTGLLGTQVETSPATAREESEFFYRLCRDSQACDRAL